MFDLHDLVQEKVLIDTFCNLARIDAPSLNERQMADCITNYLADLDLQTEEDQAATAIHGNCGNLICRIKGTVPGPAILFGTHMDTVDPCMNKNVILDPSGVLHSDGETILGADDLAGVTAVLDAVRIIKQHNLPHRDLELLFTVAEERHLMGSPQIQKAWIHAQEAYILDTSGAPGLAVIAAPGHISLDFMISGKAAHAGIAPETGISAITIAAKGIAQMPLGRVDKHTTANIGRIEGGGETNVVAETCQVTAECRSLDPARLRKQADDMIQSMVLAAAEMHGHVEYQEHVSYHPYSVDPESDVIKRFKDACGQIGIPVRLEATGGGSDLNVLTKMGITGAVLSCGMQKVHSCQEFLEVKDLVDLTRMLILLMTSEI